MPPRRHLLVEPPSQLPPLSLQLAGEPEPLPLKPKETEAPGARVPFQDLFLAVQWVPDEVTKLHGLGLAPVKWFAKRAL